jgi:hypothetical protein
MFLCTERLKPRSACAKKEKALFSPVWRDSWRFPAMPATWGVFDMRKISAALLLVSAGLLSACQTASLGGGSGGSVARPSGIDGDWVGTDGVAVSSFIGGTFTSRATDTGQVLAQGNYTYRDQKNIDIAFRSLIRNTSVNAACIVVTPSQMNCTSSSGAQFTLVRRAQSPGMPPVASTQPQTDQLVGPS